jgi:release factor glutamine methyltransferase
MERVPFAAVEARVILSDAVRKLKASAAIDHWQAGRERIEAEELLAHVMGEEPDPRDPIPARKAAAFQALIDRRATGEPVPYIKGYAEFRGLHLKVVPGVFVPRDSSEFLAEQAIRRLRGRRAPTHVDLATGLGTIALSVASEVPRAEVWGSDLSGEAVALARRNARRLGVQARFVVGDLFGGLPSRLRGTVDVITLHPPYVAKAELEHLPDEIRGWEPVHTLTDHSDDGLGLVRLTAAEGPRWLAAGGWLLVEVSPDRARAVKSILGHAGFGDVRSTIGGDIPVTRVIVGRWPG